MLRQRGFSLVELMVAVTIGLFIMTGLSVIFVSSTKSRQEVNRYGEQIENGRIAMDILGDDLRTAGFWDGLDSTKLLAPAALPDPCAIDVASLKTALPIYVQGYDNGNGAPTCITDVRPGTDILVIRRAGTCAVGAPGCTATAMTANVLYFQASHCLPPAQRLDGTSGSVTLDTELASSNMQDWFAVDTTAAGLTLHNIDCGNSSVTGAPNLAAIRPYMVHIYYVSNNTQGSDGIPALKMAELGTDGSATAFNITTIAPGIEQLQVEYGEDTNADGTPDVYSAAPATVAAWQSVISVKINVLSRNTSPSPQYTDTKVYFLGNKADATANTFGPYGDHIRRHAFSSLILLSNPAGLRGS